MPDPQNGIKDFGDATDSLLKKILANETPGLWAGFVELIITGSSSKRDNAKVEKKRN